ncbi:MAG: S49 family peptidase [Pseudomonadota bacterium]
MTEKKRFGVLPPRKPHVTVLELNGVIGSTGRPGRSLTLAKLEKPIDQAFKPKRLDAVALAINSPGGSPVQSRLIHDRIRALAEEKEVPVYAYVEDVAASGGYMLALAADEILADSSSIVGSIGVISGGFGFPEALTKLGVERRVYTAGTDKMRLDPFRPEKPDDIDWLKGLLGDMHEIFVDLVKARRGRRLSGDDAALFNGDVWLAGAATRLGLIDGTASLRDDLRRRFGERVKIAKIPTEDRGLASKLFGRSASPASDGLAALEERALWSRFGL